jgi:hypothetical protein
MIETLPVAASAAHKVRLERCSLGAANQRFLCGWEKFESGRGPDSPMHDPEWVRGYFLEDLPNITSYLLRDGNDLVCGQASFVLKDWPLKLYLGELRVAELPLRRLRLLGESPALPEDESLYDLLFQELAAAPGFDCLHLAQISVESFLWKYVTTSPVVEKAFSRYQPEPASLHTSLRFGASFEEYMRTNFSKHHRKNLRRQITRFQEEAPAPVRMVRYTEPGEVSAFFDAAVEVSRKTYQWNLHHRGLRNVELLGRRYRFAADNGWFRSYLLFCGETPCAFIAGYQWRGRFYTDEIGFDPAFAKHSPGTVLTTMAIEDLFAWNTPTLIDFGSYDKYKEEFSNENYTHCDMILFRRNAYCRLVQASHYACQLTTRAAAGALEGLRLKSRLRKILRQRSTRT